ncbi:pentatricopeptide repeat-containing protein [Carex littledalei]|uniref:Pentatricopeptide repeat-containing protein n=1 Tax=Carex littledalei TaxID=544730 RepID=A0A833QS53_9POAL|nr:pentatricopeptide repeat-containing protein [Carex littledalei]
MIAYSASVITARRLLLLQLIRLPALFPISHFSSQNHPSDKDAYFAAVHHIASIVQKDFYLERTLNRLRLPSVSSDMALRVLRASAPSNSLHALRFFKWLQSSHNPHFAPSTEHFSVLLLALSKDRLWPHLWSLAADMRARSLALPPSTFASIIESSGAARLPDLAVEIFNRLPHFGCPQTTEIYNALLSALCTARNFDGAYALVRRMTRKLVSPDKHTFSILVNAWCAAGKLREAQDFLDEMAEKGFKPPCRGRDLLLDGLIGAGYLESAKSIVLRMTKEGIVPDVATFNSMLEALCKNGDAEFGATLLHDASDRGMSPDISTYKILIPALAKQGHIESAFRLFYNSIEGGHHPLPSLYAAIIKALCKAGRFADAFGFFSDMKEKRRLPSRPVYTMLVKMCVRGGMYVEASNYLLEMTGLGLVPRGKSFDSVVHGLRHIGKHDLAKRMEQLEVSLRGV